MSHARRGCNAARCCGCCREPGRERRGPGAFAGGAGGARGDRRALSAEELSCGREDVEHLLELASALQRRLGEVGGLEWAREECRALEGATDERDLEAVFQRLPRVRNLSASARPVARAL